MSEPKWAKDLLDALIEHDIDAKACRDVADEYDMALSIIASHAPKVEGPEIVCLCGSTRFMDAFHEEGFRLTLERKIILSVGVCKHGPADHVGEWLGPEVCAALDELHLRKIDLADRVFVLDVDGYIGESTRAEINYAEKIGKPVDYLSAHLEGGGS